MVQKAKSIVKNKFWIVEEDGKKIGTIQANPDGVVLVQGPIREKFPSFKLLSSKYHIRSSTSTKPAKGNGNTVHDYPCDSFPHNPIYNLKLRLPLFTKKTNSKSFHCAGHYIVNVGNEWTHMFCPKKIVLTRQNYFGPFFSISDSANKLAHITANCN